MPTFLLAWNPNRWDWKDIQDCSEKVNSGIPVTDLWSCGNSSLPKSGDRFFMIRLGREPKGIFASGLIIADSFEGEHWDQEKRALGITTRYIDILYDSFINPNTNLILPRQLLNTPPYSKMHWDTQMSGVSIPEDVADELEKVWNAFANQRQYYSPEEVSESQTFTEGAVRQITINTYERNPISRRSCISHYGSKCVICGFDFSEIYGIVGEGFIHIHHLVALSEIGNEYQVDPIRDLIPVCPNCHAIIHKKKPSLYT